MPGVPLPGAVLSATARAVSSGIPLPGQAPHAPSRPQASPADHAHATPAASVSLPGDGVPVAVPVEHVATPSTRPGNGDGGSDTDPLMDPAGASSAPTAAHPDPSALPTTAGVPPATSGPYATAPRQPTTGPIAAAGSAEAMPSSAAAIEALSRSEFGLTDTADAPVGSIDLGTDAALSIGTRRRAPWWVAFGVSATVVIGGGVVAASSRSDAAAANAKAAAKPAVPAAVEPEPDSVGESLWQLARVNEPDDNRASPFRQRHQLLDTLATTPEAGRIDIRRNLALDLLQAGQSDEPCTVLGTALARIELAPDPYFTEVLERTAIPATGPGCTGLSRRRDSLVALLSGEAPGGADEAVDSAPDPKAAAKRRRRGATAKSKPAPQPSAEPERPRAGGLRPFGG